MVEGSARQWPETDGFRCLSLFPAGDRTALVRRMAKSQKSGAYESIGHVPLHAGTAGSGLAGRRRGASALVWLPCAALACWINPKSFGPSTRVTLRPLANAVASSVKLPEVTPKPPAAPLAGHIVVLRFEQAPVQRRPKALVAAVDLGRQQELLERHDRRRPGHDLVG